MPGIRVNAVTPAVFNRPLLRQMKQEFIDFLLSKIADAMRTHTSENFTQRPSSLLDLIAAAMKVMPSTPS